MTNQREGMAIKAQHDLGENAGGSEERGRSEMMAGDVVKKGVGSVGMPQPKREPSPLRRE